MQDIQIRLATSDDIPEIIILRRLMFTDMGATDKDKLNQSDEACYQYFSKTIPTKECFVWVVEHPSRGIIGSIALVIDTHPPGPNNLTGEIAYIHNLVVKRPFRRKGIAQRLMEMVEVYVKSNGMPVQWVNPYIKS